ncbi:MAG: tRNA epoxyqueuosine(34) reductase QueG [Nitrospiraceae bacterium]
MPLTERVKQLALDQGFDAVGIATLDAPPPDTPAPDAASDADSFTTLLQTRLRTWLDAGYQATMQWIARTPERRADPRLVLTGCRSIIVVGLNYDRALQPDERPGMGRIARYAWGRDYHLTVGERLSTLVERLKQLAPDASYKWYVDTGPIMEKAWAQQAGLGWIGKHSNLVSAEHGSWLLLGVVLTTLPLTPDTPGTDLCGTCTLCLTACPTQAMPTPYVVDAGRCLSYLTIEHRSDDIPTDLTQHVGNHLFGCDDCLDACPYNTQARPGRLLDDTPRPWALAPNLSELGTWTEQDFAAHTKDSPVRRTRFAGLQRNIRLIQQAAESHAQPKQSSSG